MIKELILTGFKSFVSDSIEFGTLTLLTGLNSSGKSSVIQSLLLLEKAYKNDRLFLEGHGSLSEWKNPFSDELNITAILDNESAVSVKNYKAEVLGEVFFPEIIYISADRFGPETSVPVYVDSNKIGRRGQNIFKCIESYADFELNEKLIHPNSEGVTFLFNLRAWLGIISPNVSFTPVIDLMSDSSYGTFNGFRAKNVGFGLSYTLPVITALLLGSVIPNSIVLIENPEAHLHPRGQAEIARLISLVAECGVQVVIETHSDHIFDGVRVYARESQAHFNELVKIYWFELDKNNNTDIQTALIDNDGRLDDWPSGLFDQFQLHASKLI